MGESGAKLDVSQYPGLIKKEIPNRNIPRSPLKGYSGEKIPPFPPKGYSGEKIKRNSPVIPWKDTLVRRNYLTKGSYTPPFFSTQNPPRNP